jgi:hypothetical protein
VVLATILAAPGRASANPVISAWPVVDDYLPYAIVFGCTKE